MPLDHIVILALVQGITEFLPISSSAHLILVPYLLGWEDQGLLVDVAMHGGTLVALVLYFHQDIKDLFWGALKLLRGRMDEGGRLFLLLCLMTLPAVMVGLTLRALGIQLRSVEIIVYTTLFFGALLYAADRWGAFHGTVQDLTIPKALLLGIFQSLALIPGVSRSGACMTCARGLGFARPESARISFLMSIPTIIAAATHTGFEAWKTHAAVSFIDIALCLGFSAFFGFLAIAFMMYWLKKSTLTVFVLYRLILGGILLKVIF